MPEFLAFPLGVNLAIFAGTAVVVWFTGVRLARWAGALATRLGLGDAIVGIVLLGVVTSLPEVAVSITAALDDNASLAVNNLLGGLAFQVAILAVADMFVGRDALTSVNAEPGVMLQGTLECIMLALVAVAIVTGDMAVPGLGVGAWSLALLPVYITAVALLARSDVRKAWHTADHERMDDADRDGIPDDRDPDAPSLRGLGLRIAGAAVLVLVAGAAATGASEAIAEQTGIGTSFVGAALLAGATSMPELSTAIESVRLRRYSMAFGDVFGTNLVDVVLILLVDAVSSGPPVLDGLGPFSIVAALIGVLTTMVFIAGLIERRNRVVLRMGWDSALVLFVYFGGLGILWTLR